MAYAEQIPYDILKVFSESMRALRSGELDDASVKATRLLAGLHRQRGGQAYMLRVRIPGGRLILHDFMRVAALAQRVSGSGRIHITLRQDLQIQDIALDYAESAVSELRLWGLSTFASGGNSLRNITASPGADLLPWQGFDPYPYARQLSERLARSPYIMNLPRKFKIGFGGPGMDEAQVWLNDLGFQPRFQAGERGFRVSCGGGLGAGPQSGRVLEDFIAADRLGALTEALLSYFIEVTPKDLPASNRFKHTVGRLGLDAIRQQLRWRSQALPSDPPVALPAPGGLQGRTLWVTAPLGDILASAALGLGALLESYGLHELRLTFDQRILLPGLPPPVAGPLARDLKGLGFEVASSPPAGRMVVCVGPESCNRGLVNSRALARDLGSLKGLPCELHISGCQNGCSQHAIAPLSLQGTVRASPLGRVPSYVLLSGGGRQEGGLHFGEALLTMPARQVRPALQCLIDAWQKGGASGDFPQWLLYKGGPELSQMLKPLIEAGPEILKDCGSDEIFELVLGGSECH